MTIGFEVYPSAEQISSDILEQFKSIGVSHVSDVMQRIPGSDGDLKKYDSGKVLVGTAVTVKTRPGDNLMIHKAIDRARPGDVIVVDGGGDMSRALFGEIMKLMCVNKGIAGIVLNGCLRDVGDFINDDFPVYAKGVTHKGPYKTGPGVVNQTIAFDDLIIHPGDLVFGDSDGVISLRPDEIPQVLKDAKEKFNTEQKKLEALRNGTETKQFVTDEELIEMGCTIHG